MPPKIRGFLGHYASLLAATPKHVWTAGNVIGTAAFLLLSALAVFLGYTGAVPPYLVAIAIGLFVFVALAWTEYDRYEELRSERDKLQSEKDARFDGEVRAFRQKLRWEELQKAIDSG